MPTYDTLFPSKHLAPANNIAIKQPYNSIFPLDKEKESELLVHIFNNTSSGYTSDMKQQPSILLSFINTPLIIKNTWRYQPISPALSPSITKSQDNNNDGDTDSSKDTDSTYSDFQGSDSDEDTPEALKTISQETWSVLYSNALRQEEVKLFWLLRGPGFLLDKNNDLQKDRNELIILKDALKEQKTNVARTSLALETTAPTLDKKIEGLRNKISNKERDIARCSQPVSDDMILTAPEKKEKDKFLLGGIPLASQNSSRPSTKQSRVPLSKKIMDASIRGENLDRFIDPRFTPRYYITRDGQPLNDEEKEKEMERRRKEERQKLANKEPELRKDLAGLESELKQAQLELNNLKTSAQDAEMLYGKTHDNLLKKLDYLESKLTQAEEPLLPTVPRETDSSEITASQSVEDRTTQLITTIEDKQANLMARLLDVSDNKEETVEGKRKAIYTHARELAERYTNFLKTERQDFLQQVFSCKFIDDDADGNIMKQSDVLQDFFQELLTPSTNKLTSYEKEYITAQIAEASSDKKKSRHIRRMIFRTSANMNKVDQAAEKLYALYEKSEQPNIQEALNTLIGNVQKHGMTYALKALDQPATQPQQEIKQTLLRMSKKVVSRKVASRFKKLTIHHHTFTTPQS